MSSEFIELKDNLREVQTQLNFLLSAFAALSSVSIDDSLRPTDSEAYHGLLLGQNLIRKMVDRVGETLKNHLSKAS